MHDCAGYDGEQQQQEQTATSYHRVRSTPRPVQQQGKGLWKIV